MFCSQCGHKISAESKFCSNCGAKVIFNNVGAPVEKDEADSRQGGRILFEVHGKELVFDDAFEKFTLERKQFLIATQPFIAKEGERIQKSVEQIITQAQNDKSRRAELDRALLAYYEYGTKAIELLTETLHESLIKKKVYSYSLDSVKSLVDKYTGNFMYVLSEFSEKLEETMAEREEIEKARAQQRGNRSYWQGGGFGVVNAIKGAITADLMNLTTGAVRGVGDMITDSRDDKRIFQMKYNLLKSKPWAEMLYKALIKDSYAVFHAYAHILQNEGLLRCPEINTKKGDALFQNSAYVDNPEEKTAILLECILNNPYNVGAYRCLLTVYDLSDDIIDLIDFFLDYYNITRLSLAYCDAIVSRISEIKDLPDALDAGLQAYEIIDRVIKTVESKKKTSKFYEFFAESSLDKLYEGMSIIEIVRRTSSDGIVHDSAESRDLYEKEYREYQQFIGSDSSGISIEEERRAIDVVRAYGFRHEILLKKIEDREDALQIRIAAQKEMDSFEGCFAHTWPVKHANARADLSELAQETFALLKHGKEAKILDCLILHTSHWGFKTTAYFVVSDFYIMIWQDDFSDFYAIRTKDIRKIRLAEYYFGISIEFDKYYSQTPDAVHISTDKKEHQVDLLPYIERVNQTISEIRNNFAFSPEAKSHAEHLDELNCLSAETVREVFTKICWRPDERWKNSGFKYLDTVVNVACSGAVSPDNIIFFKDTTLFGSGKTGIAVTSTHLINTSRKVLLRWEDIATGTRLPMQGCFFMSWMG